MNADSDESPSGRQSFARPSRSSASLGLTSPATEDTLTSLSQLRSSMGGDIDAGDATPRSRGKTAQRGNTYDKLQKLLAEVDTGDGNPEDIVLEEDANEFDDLDGMDLEDARIDPVAEALIILHESEATRRSSTEATDSDLRFGLLVDQHDILMLRSEHSQQKSVKYWMRFDMFFGSLVAVNGVIEGITNEGLVSGEEAWVFPVTSVLLLAFIIEWCMRWKANPKGLRGMMVDRWTRFDFCIIMISATDIWVFSVVDIGTGTSAIAVLRVIRLVRLVRLLRLLKSLRGLWVLVTAMTKSLSILVWAIVLIMLTCYIFGLLVIDLIGNSPEMLSDPVIQAYWGNLGRAMMSFLQISTYDDGASLMRMIVEGKHAQRHFLPIFITFVSICSLGVFNLMIGVLLTSALEVMQFDQQCDSATRRLTRHKALLELRELVHQRCSKHIGASPGAPVISRSLIMTWLDKERHLPSEHQKLTKLMEKAHLKEEDINLVFSEIKSIHQHETQVQVDDFIQGCMFLQSDVHSLHITSLTASLKSMYTRLGVLVDHLAAANDVLHKANEQVRPILKQYHVTRTKVEKEAIKLKVVKEPEDDGDADEPAVMSKEVMIQLEQKKLLMESPYGKVGAAEMALIKLDQVEKLEASKWAKFDCIFVCVVLLNGVTIGIDASKENQFKRNFMKDDPANMDFIWLAIEALFFIIFVSEFILRACLHYQMKVMVQYDTFMCIFPEVIFHSDWHLLLKLRKVLPTMLKDGYILFDVMLITFAFIDNCILRFFFSEVKFLMLLRMFRGLRLLRLARLLYLFHDLTALIGSIFGAAPVVFWSAVMLTAVIYMSAVFLQSTVMEDVSSPSENVEANWGLLSDSMLTLAKLSTFSGWGIYTKSFASEGGSWLYLFFVSFFSLAGLGILNLVTGVIVQAAFRVVYRDQEACLKRTLAEMKSITSTAKEKQAADRRFAVERRNVDIKMSIKTRLRCYFLLWKTLVLKSKADELEDQSATYNSKHNAHKAPQSEKEMALEHDKEVALVEAQRRGSIDSTDMEMVAAVTAAAEHLGQPDAVDYEAELHKVFDQLMECWGRDVKMLVRPVEEGYISGRELGTLLSDQKLMKWLEGAEIRPDHLVLLFQKLDTMGNGRVGIEQFIEGLQRLKTPVQGIDVASSKSIMRRLYQDCVIMSKDSTLLNEGLLDVVCDLRGVNVLGSHRLEAESSDEEEAHDLILEARQRMLHEEGNRLKEQNRQLKKFIESRKRDAETLGDVHCGVCLGLNPAEDTESITSAQSCKD